MNEAEAGKLVEDSEERANTIIRTAMDGFLLLDVQGRLLDVNDAYCQMTGYTREELLQMSIAELEANESSNEIAAKIIEIKQDGSDRFERQHRRKDGRIIEVELSVNYLPTSGGRIFCFLRDITERKHNEAVMAARQRLSQYAISHSLTELLRATLDEAEALTGSNVGFYHCVEPDQVTLSLQAWSTNTTQRMCKAEGAGLHYPVNQAGVWVDCIRDRKPFIHNDYASLPHRKGLPDGHSPVIRELVVPVMRGNSIVAVLGVGNKPDNYDDGDSKTVATLADLAWDITERKRTEDSLRLDSEIMANMADGVFLIRLSDGMIVQANDQFERMFGYDHEELIGQQVSVVNAPSEKSPSETAKEIIDELNRTGAWTGEVHNVRKDGTTFWCSASVTTFEDPRYGTVWISVHRDITESKRAAESLRESEENLREAQRMSHIGSWQWTLATDDVTWSEELYHICGLNPKLPPPRFAEMSSCYTPESWSLLNASVTKSLHTGESYELELDMVRQDGMTRHTSTRGEVGLDATGRIVGLHGTVQDITARKMAEDALLRNEAKQGKMVSNIGDVIVIIDQFGINRYKSSSIEKGFGWRPEDVVGISALENVHSDDLNSARKFIGSLLCEPNSTDTMECRYRCKDGSYKWIEFTGVNLVHDPDIGGILGNYHDITERKLAEDALRASDARYRAVAESAHDAIVTADSTGQIVGWNHGAERVFGYTEIEASGQPLTMLLPSRYHDGHMAGMARMQAGGEKHIIGKTVEVEGRRKDGSEVSIELSMAEWQVAEGLFYTAIIRDITGRKQVDERIRHLSSAVEQSPVSIVITDSTGAIEYVNPKFTLVSGYTLSEVRGQNPCLLKGDNTSDDEYRRLWELITQGREWRGEFHNRKKNGEYYWESASISPIIDADGLITHFLAVKEDITERKALEEQIRQAQKLDSIGQLAGGVAHDFNNILAAIMMRLDFLQQNPSFDEETQKSLAELTVAAKRAARLTRQLLIFSRKSILDVKVLDLNEVVANLLNMLDRLIGEHITVRFDRRAALPAVEADAGMLEQVVMNLAVNARDAMPHGGKMTISIEPVQIDEEQVKGNIKKRIGQFVCLSVTDTGCGMDEDTIKHIFEPFFTTKEVGKGTGLGLATVHGIVTQHKGWVNVESELGKGTTFKVFIPAIAQRRAEQATIEKTEVVRGHETILLVEDEASLRRLVAQGLRQMGYSVLEADNGQTAMKLWQEHGQQIDLLFSDMVMPEGMTGLDLAEKFKQAKTNLKIIISSGYNVEMAGHGKPTAGGIVYFQKPYEFEVLSQTVRNCLDRESQK